MPIVVDAVGTVQAIASVQIKPRMDSQIMKVNVEEGAFVKEGDILFELDGRTLRAQLAQIEAQIRKDLPIYLFAGARDPVGESGKSVTVASRNTRLDTARPAPAPSWVNMP